MSNSEKNTTAGTSGKQQAINIHKSLRGRVIERHRGMWTIEPEPGDGQHGSRAPEGDSPGATSGNQTPQLLTAILPGKAGQEGNPGDLPAVGDWVVYSLEADTAIIRGIEARKSLLSRNRTGDRTEEQVLAANIDNIAIVMALDGGRNYNDRALERYLTLAWDSGATPLVVLNKSDCTEDPQGFVMQAELIAPGVDVLLTSAVEGDGLTALTSRLTPGSTTVFIGPSGVGKSALTNALMGGDLRDTGGVRRNDHRGKHTTTSARMLSLPGGARLIDSPGLKTLQLWADEDSLDDVFEEIAALSKECRFNDCNHQGEPGCAVQDALNSGTLSAERYESYLSLSKELAFHRRKTDEKARQEDNAKWKQIAKFQKQLRKDRKNK